MEKAGQSSASNAQNLQNDSANERANKVQRVSYLMTNPATKTPTGARSHHSLYKPGSGAERLREYVILQKNRPNDNNIQFWRNITAQFFAPTATKRYCMSSYKDTEEMDDIFKVTWKCNINMCHSTPCYGFEINGDLLPRLHQIKYDVGILEEKQQVDTPLEYLGEDGQIIVHYHGAAVESEYKHVRVVHYGQLRVLFSPDLKINSWEFCAERHKEYIDRSYIIPQANQLQAALRIYQHSAQNPASATPEELQKHTDEFISHVGKMLATLSTSETPSIGQIGVDEPYVRCIQISEVLNVMRNFINYSQHGLGAKGNLVKFPQPSKNVPPGKYLNHRFQQHQSQTTSLAPYFQNCAGAGRASGFYGNGIGSMKTSSSVRPIQHIKQHTSPICVPAPLFDRRPLMAHTPIGKSGFYGNGLLSLTTSSSMRPIHQIKQHASPRNVYAEIPTQTPPIFFPTPLYDIQPQMARTSVGKSATESAAENVHMEPKTSASMQQPYRLNFNDPDDFCMTVGRIIQDVEADQSNKLLGGVTGHSDTNNNEGNVDVSAPEKGTTSGAQIDGDIFPKDAQGNYLPPDYNDGLPFEFVDFGDLSDLLK